MLLSALGLVTGKKRTLACVRMFIGELDNSLLI